MLSSVFLHFGLRSGTEILPWEKFGDHRFIGCGAMFIFNGFLKKVNRKFRPSFAILFPGQMQAFGPEARALRAKSIGGKRIPLEDPPVPPQKEAGPACARPGAPTRQLLCFGEKNGSPARPYN
jgi:hypothetical protein